MAMPTATKRGVVRRRPTEVLTGSAAVAAAIALLGFEQQTAAVLAGAMALVPAAITWYVEHFGGPGQRGAAAKPHAYAPALDDMYAHLAQGLGRALDTPRSETGAHLALLRQAAGVVSVLDPRLARSEFDVPAESEDEPLIDEPVVVDAPAEQEGGAPEVVDEPAEAPSAAPRRRARRRAAPATV